MIELVVVNIMSRSSDNRAHMLILQERGGLRKIVVALGLSEAQSIAFAMQNKRPSRKLTHDLFCAFASAFDIDMRYVIINHIEDGTYHSVILFEQEGNVQEIDARTSDAIALALRTGVPILINEELLNRTCIQDEQNGLISIPLNVVDENIIRKAMDEAVRNEDYELAKALKDELDSRSSGSAQHK